MAQWYHQYGEAGTKQAVERYAKGFDQASVTVQWTPGDYDKTVADALVTDYGPLQSAFGDDFGVLPWPRHSASLGNPSVPIGAYGAAISAKSKHPGAAKAYLRWLWVDQTDKQLDFAQSYGFHVPARESLSQQAEKLKSAAAADAVKLVPQYGKAQTPLLWTPASGAAFNAALTKIITGGADAATQLKTAKGAVVAELNRVVK